MEYRVKLRFPDNSLEIGDIVTLPNFEAPFNGTEIITCSQIPINITNGIDAILEVRNGESIISVSCFIVGPWIMDGGYYSYNVSVNSKPKTVRA
jgi:hypothetical protein